MLSQISKDKPLLLVGCGKMGGAMLQGWLVGGLSPDAVIVADPYKDSAQALAPQLDESCFVEDISALPRGIAPGFIILAVKPQMMDQVMNDFKSLAWETSVFLSIAAGKTIGYFERHLGQEQAIVRAMPNLPASIGKGITVACPNRHVTAEQKATCHELLLAAGAVEWVERESLIDAVTAVSGSGPAYVFHLVEALASAGESLGLDKRLADKLAMQTICGAGALLAQSEQDARQLRKNVTSPGGTTEAALDILMGDEGLGKLITHAVRAAHQRSRELAD